MADLPLLKFVIDSNIWIDVFTSRAPNENAKHQSTQALEKAMNHGIIISSTQTEKELVKTLEMLLEKKTITLREQELTLKAFKMFSIKTKNNSAGYIRENINELQQCKDGDDWQFLKLADLNSLWLETQVNVNYAKNLKIGQKAQITFTNFPDKTINTRVSFINPEINQDSRLLLIRMEISNPNLQLKPGMQAMAKLTQSNLKGLYIPVDAVIREENASYIWVEKRAGVFENVMVETGIEANGMIEIRSEIDPAKKVVITGAYAINSEYIFRKGSDPMAGHDM